MSDPATAVRAPTAAALAALRQAVDAAQEAELARAFGANSASIDIRRAVLAVNPDIRVTRFGDRWFAHIGGAFLLDGRDALLRIESDSPDICWLRIGSALLGDSNRIMGQLYTGELAPVSRHDVLAQENSCRVDRDIL